MSASVIAERRLGLCLKCGKHEHFVKVVDLGPRKIDESKRDTMTIYRPGGCQCQEPEPTR